jgi:hypothetical protein
LKARSPACTTPTSSADASGSMLKCALSVIVE